MRSIHDPGVMVFERMTGIPLVRHPVGARAFVPQFAGLGVDAPGAPAYVGASTTPFGQPFRRVLREAAAGVAMALDNYAAAATPGQDTWFFANRQPQGPTGLGNLIMSASAGRGVAIIGDPLSSPSIAVLFGSSVPELQRLADESKLLEPWWVLLEPEAGWVQGDDKELDLISKVQSAITGYTWGAIAGAVVGIGLIGWVASRAR